MRIPVVVSNTKLADGVGVKLIAILLLHNLIVLYPDRRMVVQPSCNDEAANGPAPDENGDGRSDEQCRHENKKGNADPEKSKDDCCTKGEHDG